MCFSLISWGNNYLLCSLHITDSNGEFIRRRCSFFPTKNVPGPARFKTKTNINKTFQHNIP